MAGDGTALRGACGRTDEGALMAVEVDLLVVVQRVDVELLDDERLVGEARGEVEGLADDDPLLAIDDGLEAPEGSHLNVEAVQVDFDASDCMEASEGR